MEEKKITKKQTQLLHIGKSKLQLTEEQYRGMLSDYWVQSSVDLTYDEASDMLKRMVKMGFRIITKRYGGKKKLPPDITQLPSKEILQKIEHLKADIQWIVKPCGFERWLKKYLHIDRPRTMAEAQKIVEGLKAMRDRQQRARSMEQGAESLRRDGGLHGGHYKW